MPLHSGETRRARAFAALSRLAVPGLAVESCSVPRVDALMAFGAQAVRLHSSTCIQAALWGEARSDNTIMSRDYSGRVPSAMVGRLTKPCSRIAMTSCGIENPLAAIC
jgi:hypothetical protein